MHEYKTRRAWSTRQKSDFCKIAEFGHVDKKTPHGKFSSASFAELKIVSDKENVYFTADESIVKRGDKLESFVAFDQNSQSKINAFTIDNGKCLGTMGLIFLFTGGLELCCKELCCRTGITLQNWNYAAAKFFKKVMLQGWNYAAI